MDKKEFEKALLKFAQFLNTSSVHAALDHSGYWIGSKFYSNKDMVQEFISNYGKKPVVKKVAPKKGRPKK